MAVSSETVTDLLRFIDAAPTPYHAVREVSGRLDAAGFHPLAEAESWHIRPGDRCYVVRGDSSIAAFLAGTSAPYEAGFRWVGAHTDSPNLRIKPVSAIRELGYRQLGVEVYGGVLLSTWMDRDLSIAGRVLWKRRDDSVGRSLVRFPQALGRIPNLAIHLNREVNSEGLSLNPQRHMSPIVGLELGSPSTDLRVLLADQLNSTSAESIEPADILDWDLSLYDTQPCSLGGAGAEFIYAARLDNLASCHASLAALLQQPSQAATVGIVLYDHEECGSRSAQGAASNFLQSLLGRLASADARTPPVEALARAIARSRFVSADMAHAVHPNYVDKHDPQHRPLLGQGPVIKHNANQSYSTDGDSAAHFASMCAEVGVNAQRFVMRSDLRCGSTIGPIVATSLGIRSVDVGNPMLSMHSCREMAATVDVQPMIDVLTRFFKGN